MRLIRSAIFCFLERGDNIACTLGPLEWFSQITIMKFYGNYSAIPYERIQTHFAEVFDMPLSAGSLYNVNADAYQRLELFETLNKVQLRQAPVA